MVLLLTVVALTVAAASPAFAWRRARVAHSAKVTHDDQQKELVGQVTAVGVGSAATITVKGSGSDPGVHTFSADRSTTVTINGAAGRADTIKVGDRVTVHYIEHHIEVANRRGSRDAGKHNDAQGFVAGTITVTR